MDEKNLKLLRAPFPDHQVSKLPKPTKKQTEDLKGNYKLGVRCKLCDGWHQPEVVHLDYVGHAALTDRLLDADINWNWEPLSFTENGLPRFDESGGLWIKLTVCGVTRLGYGHAASSTFKDVGAREKEVIGDALRNAGMRFGAALDLWHKGDLHIDEDDPTKTIAIKQTQPVKNYAPNMQEHAPLDDSELFPEEQVKPLDELVQLVEQIKMPSNDVKDIIKRICGRQVKASELPDFELKRVIDYIKLIKKSNEQG